MAIQIACPRGVRLHRNGIQINFPWHGKTRFVTVPGLAQTVKGIKQAGALREIILREIELGTFAWSNHFPEHKLAKAEQPKSTHFTVSDLLKRWLESQKGRLTPRYLKNSTYRVNSILVPAFGHIPLSILTPGHIREWAAMQDLARKTLSNYLAPLRSAIREAIADHIIEKDPLAGLTLPKEKTSVTQRIEARRDEVNPYARNEIDRLLSGSNKYPSERNMYQFAVWSGVRPGELIALEWRNVDLKRGTAYICKAISADIMSDIKTKAKGRREIMLLPGAIEALQAQREITQLSKHDRVFVNRQREPFPDYNSLYWCFHYACKRAGIICRGIGQTRHTFASWMLEAGEDEAWVSKMLGHTTVEMVRKHYRKFIKDNSTTGYTLKSNWEQDSDIGTQDKHEK